MEDIFKNVKSLEYSGILLVTEQLKMKLKTKKVDSVICCLAH